MILPKDTEKSMDGVASKKEVPDKMAQKTTTKNHLESGIDR